MSAASSYLDATINDPTNGASSRQTDSNTVVVSSSHPDDNTNAASSPQPDSNTVPSSSRHPDDSTTNDKEDDDSDSDEYVYTPATPAVSRRGRRTYFISGNDEESHSDEEAPRVVSRHGRERVPNPSYA